MKELDLPSLIKDRVIFYNKLWGKKVRGEDVASFSHLMSDDFERTIVFDESNEQNETALSGLRKGKMIFADKNRDLVLVAEIEGNLEDLRDNIDADKRNKNDSIFEFCKLNGEVRFETSTVIIEGYYENGKTMGGFYEHIKANKLPGVKGPKDGAIVRTIKQVYDRDGLRHGIWYTQNDAHRESIAYNHGELKADSREVKYFAYPKTRTQKLIDALLSVGVIANIARYVSKRRRLSNIAAVKGNANQGR